MSVCNIFKKEDKKPVIDDAYWKMRFEEDFKDKEILTRFLVCFGYGHYDEFCGVKEIKGYYGKTYSDNTEKDRWVQDKDTFYQIDFDESYSKRLHDPVRLFETQRQAQDAYNENVHHYIEPLQKRINDLEEALVFNSEL